MPASYYPVRIGAEIIGVGVVVVDVSDRLQLEAALHELTRAEEFRSAVMGEVAEGVYTLDPDGRLMYMNSAACRTAGAGLAVVFRDLSPSGRSSNVIRVLIADFDKSATRSFQALLDHHEGIEVVAVSSTSAAAVREAQRLKPDVVLVDSDLGDLGGITATRRIKARIPSANVILMTDRYDDDVALASIDAGCAGVLDKRRAWVELVSAVRGAYHGETTSPRGSCSAWFRRSGVGGTREERPSSPSGRKRSWPACGRDCPTAGWYNGSASHPTPFATTCNASCSS